jgi:hypothetical protein
MRRILVLCIFVMAGFAQMPAILQPGPRHKQLDSLAGE